MKPADRKNLEANPVHSHIECIHHGKQPILDDGSPYFTCPRCAKLDTPEFTERYERLWVPRAMWTRDWDAIRKTALTSTGEQQ